MPDSSIEPVVSKPETTPGPSLSIVAVDDDADFRQFIRAVLEADGHEVRTAAGPDEFFAAARCPFRKLDRLTR